MTPTPDTLVLVFIRFPEPGHVKTRLAATIGEDEAADVYTLLAEDTIDSLRPGARQGDYRVLLYATPVNKLGRIALWLNDGNPPILEAIPQPEGPLDRRLAVALQWGFEKLGAGRVVLVGSDCPEMDSALVNKAVSLLEENDFTLGRARDGGFHLLAAAANRPEVFEGVVWSDSTTADSLAARIRELGLRVDCESLPVLMDVDTEEDLRRLEPEHLDRLRERAVKKGFDFFPERD